MSNEDRVAEVVDGVAGTFGGLAVTSLAAIAALLGGFYEADNDPSDEATPGAKPAAKAAAGGNKRIAAAAAADDLEDDLEIEPEKKRAKK